MLFYCGGQRCFGLEILKTLWFPTQDGCDGLCNDLPSPSAPQSSSSPAITRAQEQSRGKPQQLARPAATLSSLSAVWKLSYPFNVEFMSIVMLSLVSFNW